MTNNPRNVAAEKLDKNFQAAPAPQLADLDWHCPKDPPFHLAGFAWFDTDRIYRRMPVTPPQPLPPAVDQLANATAGGQIRFRTDSTKVGLRVQLAGPASMAHMPATGQCGFDCYLGEPGAQRYYFTTKWDHKQAGYEFLICDVPAGPTYTVTLNFPLYQGVESVEIGLDRGAKVLPPPAYDSDRPVVVYGTSITQGGCASRPGMCYTNILSRRINRPFVNLGFSGNGKGEPQVARTISTIAEPGLFVLDYDANCPSLEHVQRTLPTFIDILRDAHPATPMLVISRIPVATHAWHPEGERERVARRDFFRDTVTALRDGGDANVQFLDGGDLLGDDWQECTVDSVHPNDLGFWNMARSMTPVIRKILAGA